MSIIGEEDCRTIIQAAFPDAKFKILEYFFENIEDLVEGFLSSSRKLVIRYELLQDGSKKEACFFAKTLPEGNEFHERYVKSTRGFDKEVFFFLKIKPNLDLWSSRQCVPRCYLAVLNKIVVLDLMSHYRVKDISEYFDSDEIRSSIASVATLHSASMMCESKNGLNPTAVWGDYFFDALYLRKDGHLGFVHMTNGIKAIKAIIEQKFPEIDSELKRKIYDIYDRLPETVEPSKKFRNVISHGDLYTNNIMFSTGSKPLRAKIVDFQLFRFNPPALDLLMLIYLTTEVRNADELNELTEFYYESVRSDMKTFGMDSSVELPKQEFTESLVYFNSTAIAIALLFQHYVNLPPATLKQIMGDAAKLSRFILEDRNDTVLSAFEFDAAYRSKLTTTISMLIDSFK